MTIAGERKKFRQVGYSHGKACDRRTGASASGRERTNRILAWRAVDSVVEAGARWKQQEELFRKPQPEKAADPEGNMDAATISARRLARAIRAERRLGRSGHWSYDPARHLALMQALRLLERQSGKRFRI